MTIFKKAIIFVVLVTTAVFSFAEGKGNGASENESAPTAMSIDVPKGGGILRFLTLRPSNTGGDWVLTDTKSGRQIKDIENANGFQEALQVQFSSESSKHERNCELAVFVIVMEQELADSWRFNPQGVHFYTPSNQVTTAVSNNGAMLTVTVQAVEEYEEYQTKFSFVADHLTNETGTTKVTTYQSPDPVVGGVRNPGCC